MVKFHQDFIFLNFLDFKDLPRIKPDNIAGGRNVPHPLRRTKTKWSTALNI